jgi:hypothetical protein
MGRKGHKSEAYPGGTPSGAALLPFAQLGLSADAPFVDGVSSLIPFDTVVYQSRAFGDFEIVTGASALFVPFGVYLVTLQANVDTTPTQLDANVIVQSGSDGDSGANSSALAAIALTMSAVRLGSETPFPGHVLPVAVLPAALVTGGGNGNFIADTTKLFVWQLAQFAATP